MNFLQKNATRIGSGERMNGNIKNKTQAELYYYSGEYVGKKIISKNQNQATVDKNTKIYCAEVIPLNGLYITIADNIYTIKKEQNNNDIWRKN